VIILTFAEVDLVIMSISSAFGLSLSRPTFSVNTVFDCCLNALINRVSLRTNLRRQKLKASC